jgi:rhodanese-related sulfurtransferase
MRIIKVAILTLMSYFAFGQTVTNGDYQEMLTKLLSHNVPEVSVAEIDEKAENVYFLDAREQDEYNVSHIKEAIWVGYKSFNFKSVKDLPKDAKIIIYYSVGYRSEKVAEKLIKKGYTDVSNLFGGLFEWSNAGKPMVDNSDKSTKKIHAYNKNWGKWVFKGEKVY